MKPQPPHNQDQTGLSVTFKTPQKLPTPKRRCPCWLDWRRRFCTLKPSGEQDALTDPTDCVAWYWLRVAVYCELAYRSVVARAGRVLIPEKLTQIWTNRISDKIFDAIGLVDDLWKVIIASSVPWRANESAWPDAKMATTQIPHIRQTSLNFGCVNNFVLVPFKLCAERQLVLSRFGITLFVA